ncbi:hypothetical protein NX02_09730 [Sphingomonas sanxanigenens DSM 19645 = NX02]|uniref:Uncharacterized protein n=2 Tax=Sphingomonas sanxanigenens TaxID=397260 RepID=W0A999_9SPHN|nr:hypothetical protein NX02_09730 [Sphingomonas sanxanigenens DSM 19645 = NX02]
MAVSTRVDFLEAFYRGGFAGYLNILFFPMTALMVLGVGYAQEWLSTVHSVRGGSPLSGAAVDAIAADMWDRHERAMDEVGATTDMFDPRSGALWIGNPLNPQNAGYIDPHTGVTFNDA